MSATDTGTAPTAAGASATTAPDLQTGESHTPSHYTHTRQSSTIYSHTRTNSILAQTARQSTTDGFDFALTDDQEHPIGFQPPIIFPIPNYSTVSLVTVWALGVLGSSLCYFLAEVYQEEAFTEQRFPLTFVTSLACHLSVLSSLVVYVIGRQKHGARVYRFYQPFAGGQRFVMMQVFGVFLLVASFLGTVAYVQVLQRTENIRHGVFVVLNGHEIVGSVVLFLSPRYFDPAQSRRARAAHKLACKEGKTGHQNDFDFSFENMLTFLRCSPNTETALVCAITTGQAMVSLMAHQAPDFAFSAVILVLVMQLCCGVIVHIFIGYKTRPGYRRYMGKLPRPFDTFFFYMCWSCFIASLVADWIALWYAQLRSRMNEAGGHQDTMGSRVNNGSMDAPVPHAFFHGVTGLNIYTTLALMFFIRTTSFRKRAVQRPSFIFELGGLGVIIAGLFAASVTIGIQAYVQMYRDSLYASGDEGKAQLRVLRIGAFLSQGFAMVMTPMIQMAGKAIYGDAFSILRPYRGFPSLLALQTACWLFYILAHLSTAMFVITDNATAGSLAAIMAALSSLTLLFSLREYRWVHCCVTGDALEHDNANKYRDTFEDLFSPASSPHKKEHDTSPTLAETVQQARLAFPSGSMLPMAGISHPSDPMFDENEDPAKRISHVLNGEMIVAFMLSFSNVLVRIVIDFAVGSSIDEASVPVKKLATLAHGLYILTVPIAHFSGRDKGIHVLRPFSGSSTYVALQVLGWFIYAAMLVTILMAGVLSSMNEDLAAQWIRMARTVRFIATMIGLLQLIPLVLITVSIAYQAAVVSTDKGRRALTKEAFIVIRDVLRERLTDVHEPDELALLQLAFTTLSGPALREYEIRVNRKAMRLYLPSKNGEETESRHGGDDATDFISPVESALGEESADTATPGATSSKPARTTSPRQKASSSPGRSKRVSERATTASPGSLVEEESWTDSDQDNDDSESGEDVNYDAGSLRRQHGAASVIVILMSTASAALYMVAAFFSKVTMFALACAVCGLLLCTVDCIGIHVGYGMLRNGKHGEYAVFMPFRGGAAFVYRQIAGWSCYAGTFLVTLIAGLEDEGFSATAMTIGAVLSVLSQFFILASVPRFVAGRKRQQQSYLEQNGEGIVAVLAFAGTISFAYVYERLRAFFYAATPDEELAAAADGFFTAVFATTSRRSKVPFVIALISIIVAVPMVLIAMARTTRQWRNIARQMRRQHRMLQRKRSDDATGTATPRRRSRRSSPDGRHAGGGRRSDRERRKQGLFAVALTNLLEVATILFSSVVPFTVLFLIYYMVNNYSPRVLRALTSTLPTIFAVAVATLALSVVPYLANVGVPKFTVTLRVYLVTYCLYGMPIVVASFLLLPAYVTPCVGSRYTAFCTFVATLLGSYRQTRMALKWGVYSLFGYCSYHLFLDVQDITTGGRPLLSWEATVLFGLYAVDLAYLYFWLWYLPLYDSTPEITGAHRSLVFTEFARRYLWEDVVRFFNFKIIMDDPSVHMRDESTRYLFSFHPHGVFPGTALFCSLTRAWEQKMGLNDKQYVSTHGASIIYNVPVIRDFNLRQGALSVSRRGLDASLNRGNSVLIVTGGQAEMLHTKLSDKVMTLVTHHMGFIRMAIRHRVPLVPLICFAENNVMGLVQFPRIQRVMIKILGFPFPMFPYGAFFLPFPRRTPLTLVVGRALQVPEGANADDDEQIKQYSKAYFEEIKELFYRHRAAAGYPEMELVLIDGKAEAAKRRAEMEAKWKARVGAVTSKPENKEENGEKEAPAEGEAAGSSTK